MTLPDRAPRALILLPDGPACMLGGPALAASPSHRSGSVRRWFERRALELMHLVRLV